MKQQNIQTKTFANGLTLIVEPMDDVKSAAVSLLVPAGSVFDPPGHNGSASVLCEWMPRGAGDRDSKQLSAALDNLGVQHSESVGLVHLTFTGATLAESLPQALPLYADMILRPWMPEDQFEASRSGVEQSLMAIEDEPRQKIILELRRRCFDSPWGLPAEGSLTDLEVLSPQSIRDQYAACFRPNEAIFGIAGNVDFDEVVDLVGNLFGDWCGSRRPHSKPHRAARRGTTSRSTRRRPHRRRLRRRSLPRSRLLRGLGGGERAERRNELPPLHRGPRTARAVLLSPRQLEQPPRRSGACCVMPGRWPSGPRKRSTFRFAKLKRLGEGIAEDELARCKARAKSSLIMQQESTIARSSSIARDWYHLNRVTTLAEVRDKIDALSVKDVLEYVDRHPADDFTILTIGPKPLEEPREVP